MRDFFRNIQNKIAIFAAFALAQFGPIKDERKDRRRLSKCFNMTMNGGKRATGRADVPQHIQEQLIRAAQAKRERKAYKRRADYTESVCCNPCLNDYQKNKAYGYVN